MKLSLKVVAAAAVLAMPTVKASAQGYDLYVGYVDGLRGSAFFPSVWFGDPLVQFFFGYSGSAPDAGAIMFKNTSASTIKIEGLTYSYSGGFFYDFAGAFRGGDALPAGGVTLDPGKYAIFTGINNSGDFDTSDINVGSCSSPNLTAPHLGVTVSGSSAGYDDTGLRLTTGGMDLANCPPGTNESFGWALVGTTSDRTDTLASPEPSSIALMASGLAMIGGVIRRRRSAK